MRQFVPFEDEWDALEQLDASCLIPYRVDLPCRRSASAQRDTPMSPAPRMPPATSSASPAAAPVRFPLTARGPDA